MLSKRFATRITQLRRFSAEAVVWQRKPGPPRVWREIETEQRASDGKALRFSIQEIPENRYEDAISFMTMIYAREEALNQTEGLITDPDALEYYQGEWRFALQQGIANAAFVVDKNNPKPQFAAIDVIMVNTPGHQEGWRRKNPPTSERLRRLEEFEIGLEEKANIYETYNVDKYITTVGGCVHPQYRRMGLSYETVRSRDDSGAAYDVHAAATLFTSPAMQSAAMRAGYELLVEQDYADFLNDGVTKHRTGEPSMLCKFMGKRILKLNETSEREEPQKMAKFT